MNMQVNNAIVNLQNLLNTVSQDSTVAASLLVEDSGFYDLLCNMATNGYNDEQAYDHLMAYINANF